MKIEKIVAVTAPGTEQADSLADALADLPFARHTTAQALARLRTLMVLGGRTVTVEECEEAVLSKDPAALVRNALDRVAASTAADAPVLLDTLRTQAELDYLAARCREEGIGLTLVIVGEPHPDFGHDPDTDGIPRTFHLSEPGDAARYPILAAS